MLSFIFTLLAGLAFGYLFHRIRIPGGVLVGSIVGVAALNICCGAAYVPLQAKVLAQLTAGAFIGTTVDKSDIRRLRQIWRPALLLILSYLAANLLLGLLIDWTSPLDLMTSLFCAVPGGMSDVPMIAADLGADAAKVAAVQFVRMLVCTGVFPMMINLVCKKDQAGERPAECTGANAGEPAPNEKRLRFSITAAAAVLSGILGYLCRMPAGTMCFSLVSVLLLKLAFGKAYLPGWVKRMAQVLSGVYIGSLIGLSELLALRFLVLPALLLVAGYTVFCFLACRPLRRLCNMTRKESMLAATPAGASDMALISLDMGVQNADLVTLQIIRLVVVIAAFPQIINFVCFLAGV
jgi:membrane AbrB-like protein